MRVGVVESVSWPAPEVGGLTGSAITRRLSHPARRSHEGKRGIGGAAAAVAAPLAAARSAVQPLRH
jgi:hypothetical protein